MEWWITLPLIFLIVILAMGSGISVAFAFMGINVAGIWIIHGERGMVLLAGSIFDSLSNFAFIAVPMFFLLGEVLFHSRVIDLVMETVDKWMGKIRARLLFVCLTAGTGLATLSGAGMADTALLGSTLYPDMEKRGYSKTLSLGVIVSSGLLAAIIPPSGLAVLLAALAEISAGRLLTAGIFPGLLLVSIYTVYILIRVRLNPDLAPIYDQEGVSLSEKLVLTAKLFPLGVIVFSVMGFIILGIATPSEAAATGALAAILVVALYGRLNIQVLFASLTGVVRIAGMVLLIIAGATAFSQLLAMTGATEGLFNAVIGLDVNPTVILIMFQLLMLLLGLILEGIAIFFIVIPIVAPLVDALGFDPIHFYLLMLLNVIIGNESPPFGLSLFVLKGVVPHVSMADIYRAQLPFVAMDMVAMLLIVFFPQIALWLPNKLFD